MKHRKPMKKTKISIGLNLQDLQDLHGKTATWFNNLLFLLLALAAAVLMILCFDSWMTAPAGAGFLPPDDPNFIEDFVRCAMAPDCNEIDYMAYVHQWDIDHAPEPPEPPQYEPEPAVQDSAWTDVHALILRAFCEDWLTDEVVVIDQTYPYDPNLAFFYAHSIEKQIKGRGWKYTLTVWRDSQDNWWYNIKVTRPRTPVNLNDFAILSKNWMLPSNNP